MRLFASLTAALIVLVMSQPGHGQEPASPPSATGTSTAPQVFAASSLTEVLGALADQFARDTRWPRPKLVFGGSSKLARQIEAGAPADVVLTADEAWMDTLAAGELLLEGTSRTLAVNRLVVVVPRDAAFAPRQASELADARVKLLAVAGDPVPAGRRAREALTHHRLLETLTPRFVRSPNVRAALALVAQGEVDAGIVYATDAQVSPDVRLAFAFDRSAHQAIRYPVALTRRAASNAAARAFYDYLQSHRAQEILSRAGFRIPGAARAARDQGHGAGDGQSRHGESAEAAMHAPIREGWLEPLLLSAWVATLSLMLSIIPALFLGWLLARKRFRGKALLSTALLTPLVLPPVVTGYLLLWLFGRNGPFAAPLEAMGLQIAFSQWGAVIAAGVVGFPLLIIMTRNAIESVDSRYEQLAETLGMHPLKAFLKVTLPMALPGVLAGCVLAFARALGEFGATAMLASDVPGETRTLALAVYALYEQPGGAGAAHVLVGISVALCLIALIGYERLTAAQQQRLTDRAK